VGKWVAIVGGALVAVPILMAGIGLALPKGHVASCRARFHQSPEALWAAVSDFPRWPEWNPAVRSMERAPDRDGKPAWVVHGKWGEMPQIVEVFEPPLRMVTRIPEDAQLGFSGSWSYDIAPAADGAVLTITERGEVSNPFFRFMSGVVFDPGATARAFLRALGTSFGESVSPGNAG